VHAYVTQQGAGPVQVDELDGLTISHWESHPRWWFNLRASNTEPLLRLNVEAADEDIMEKVRDDVLALVRESTPPASAAGVTGATGVSGADTAAKEA
jgi:phosphomannomutase